MDAAETVSDLVDAFERAGDEYLIGGSMASIVHGEPRSTRDVDVVVTLGDTDPHILIETLQERFYVDRVAAERAIATGNCFNAIHLDRFFQADIFTPHPSEWRDAQFRRRTRRQLAFMDKPQALWMASAEDSLLKQAEMVSPRQRSLRRSMEGRTWNREGPRGGSRPGIPWPVG
jgi:hypothetical protein